MAGSQLSGFDNSVRLQIYAHFRNTGRAPQVAECAQLLGEDLNKIRESYQRLAAAHIVVLQPNRTEILMAHPFSAVPTPFLVKLGERICYGNCIWDALGIPAMLQSDARISASCGCCNQPIELVVENNRLIEQDWLIHFALPARRWWDDIIFT